MEDQKLRKAGLFPVSMLAKDLGLGKYLCCRMEVQCVVDQLFHHGGLLLLLTVYQDENQVPDYSKLGMFPWNHVSLPI